MAAGMKRGRKRFFGDEKGMALVFSLILLIMISGLGLLALMMAEKDISISGHFRRMKTGEAAADAALELALAMIFSNHPSLALPFGADPAYAQTFSYTDDDLDVTFEVRQKIEDNIHYDDDAPHPPHAAPYSADMIVRYGKDFRYGNAPQPEGKQPVYTVRVTDNQSGVKAEAEVIASLCLNTPSAIFVKGGVTIRKDAFATEETIEIVAERGRPALATATTTADVFIQHAVSTEDVSDTSGYCIETGAGRGFTDQNATSPFYCVNWLGTVLFPGDLPTTGGGPQAPYYEYQEVFTDAVIGAELAAGEYNRARNMQFILLGVGDRDADLDVYTTLAEAEAVFNFDQADEAVVMHDFAIPGGDVENLFCAGFTDFRDLADLVIVGDETVPTPTVPSSNGKDLTPFSLGTEADPEIVYAESNMNDDGTYVAGKPPLTLVGSNAGNGILVVNGDLIIQGDIDWEGLMMVRGHLIFQPWDTLSGPANRVASPGSKWDGWIMVGGNLELTTLYGGSIELGYETADAQRIEEILNLSIPNRVLSWRRVYN